MRVYKKFILNREITDTDTGLIRKYLFNKFANPYVKTFPDWIYLTFELLNEAKFDALSKKSEVITQRYLKKLGYDVLDIFTGIKNE